MILGGGKSYGSDLLCGVIFGVLSLGLEVQGQEELWDMLDYSGVLSRSYMKLFFLFFPFVFFFFFSSRNADSRALVWRRHELSLSLSPSFPQHLWLHLLVCSTKNICVALIKLSSFFFFFFPFFFGEAARN